MKNNMVSSQKIPNILIVDDIPANLKVLGDMLKGDGYKVRPVPNGALALLAAEKEKPEGALSLGSSEGTRIEFIRNL